MAHNAQVNVELNPMVSTMLTVSESDIAKHAENIIDSLTDPTNDPVRGLATRLAKAELLIDRLHHIFARASRIEFSMQQDRIAEITRIDGHRSYIQY